MKKREWPFVRRSEHLRIVSDLNGEMYAQGRRAEREQLRAERAEHDRDDCLRREATAAADAAHWKARYEESRRQTEQSFASALAAIVEVRGALKEAASISKLAAHALFAVPDGEVPESTSVRQADRRAAERLREQDEQERR